IMSLLVLSPLCLTSFLTTIVSPAQCRGLGDTIVRSSGDSVELPCSCTQQTKEDPQTVQWGFKRKFTPGDYRADHSAFPEDGSQNPRYRGRVQILNQNQPGTVALIISHLTEEDEGTYLCGNNRRYNRAVTLQVSTGKSNRGLTGINFGFWVSEDTLNIIITCSVTFLFKSYMFMQFVWITVNKLLLITLITSRSAFGHQFQPIYSLTVN
uniref:Ig-like domain-containing protein n=1 Tax=Pygocentrus nattereri TaxID=42514 RepID=A0AAR2JU50_PYGNA